MKQPSLHHRHTLRTFIVAVIMILANATAALAKLTVITYPSGFEECVKVENGTEIYINEPDDATLKSVMWYENDPRVSDGAALPCADSYMGYYIAPQSNGYVVATFDYISPNGTCGKSNSDNVYWYTRSTGNDNHNVLIIYGSGAMADYVSLENTPWWDYHETIKTLIISDGVTSIGNNAFSNFSKLTSVSLPSSLTSIGSSAFEGCDNLTSINLPTSLTSIGSSTFKGCNGLTSINLPTSLTSIGSSAFEGCNGLTSLDIPTNVNDIGNRAFYNCTILKTVNVFSPTPPTLGDLVFDGNASDRKIYVPKPIDTYKTAEGWSSYKDDIDALNLPSVPYINADGNIAYCYDYTELTPDEIGTFRPSGWYVLSSDINYDAFFLFSDSNFGNDTNGDTHIILCDGKTMTLNSDYSFAIYSETSLHIYAQSGGTGTIIAKSSFINTSGIGIQSGSGDIIINGGHITAFGGKCGIDSPGNVTINGGTVSATYASTNDDVSGIHANVITLGWHNASDRIYADSYNGTVKIKTGQALVDKDNSHRYAVGDGNALSADALTALAGKTLMPGLLLNDGADNNAQIAALNGLNTTAILQDRTLYKDGSWNTLCLPFPIANIEAEGCPLKGATMRELDEAYITGSTLTLNFKEPVNAIEAGKPYIVKWESTEGTELKNPVFSGVTVSDATNDYDTHTASPAVTTDERVRFIGTYDQKTIAGEDKSILFLGAGNALYYPSGENRAVTIGACRAYFKIGDDTAQARQLTDFNLNFGEEATGVISIENGKLKIEDDNRYSLDGRKLSCKPTAKGLYIHGEVKVVIK